MGSSSGLPNVVTLTLNHLITDVATTAAPPPPPPRLPPPREPPNLNGPFVASDRPLMGLLELPREALPPRASPLLLPPPSRRRRSRQGSAALKRHLTFTIITYWAR